MLRNVTKVLIFLVLIPETILNIEESIRKYTSRHWRKPIYSSSPRKTSKNQ